MLELLMARSVNDSLYSSLDLNTSEALTVYVLSELLTWLSKQLQKLKVHYTSDAHKGHFSNTVTIWPQNIQGLL
jgi:hypothetical protein